jgi:hypothetical protein
MRRNSVVPDQCPSPVWDWATVASKPQVSSRGGDHLTTEKTERRRGRPAADANNEDAVSLARTTSPGIIGQIERLVTENAALRKANRELDQANAQLRALVASIERALDGSARRGRPQKTASATGRLVPLIPGQKAPRRSRQPITDPATLQKRRAALEKAREALAVKRAAAKAS